MLSEQEIEAGYVRGRASWPNIPLSLTPFREMAREQDVKPSGLSNWPDDFYLACAAGQGQRAAIVTIDMTLSTRTSARLRRLGASADALADTLQTIRERLFSGPSARIRAYNAAG